MKYNMNSIKAAIAEKLGWAITDFDLTAAGRASGVPVWEAEHYRTGKCYSYTGSTAEELLFKCEVRSMRRPALDCTKWA